MNDELRANVWAAVKVEKSGEGRLRLVERAWSDAQAEFEAIPFGDPTPSLARAIATAEMCLAREFDDWWGGSPAPNVRKAVGTLCERLFDPSEPPEQATRRIGGLLAAMYARADFDASHAYELLEAWSQSGDAATDDRFPGYAEEVLERWRDMRKSEPLDLLLDSANAEERETLREIYGLKTWSADECLKRLLKAGSHDLGPRRTYTKIARHAADACGIPYCRTERDSPAILESRMAELILDEWLADQTPEDLANLLEEVGLKGETLRRNALATGGRIGAGTLVSLILRQVGGRMAKRTLLDILLRRAAVRPLAGAAVGLGGVYGLVEVVRWIQSPAMRKVVPTMIVLSVIRGRVRAESSPEEQTCPKTGKQVELTAVRSWPLGVRRSCLACGGEFRFEGPVGLRHYPSINIDCTVDPSVVTTTTRLKESVRCGGCGFRITWNAEVPIHEPVHSVACHLTPNWTVVPADSQEAVCIACDGEIRIVQGRGVHRPLGIRVEQEGSPSDPDQALFLVHGYANGDLLPKDYTTWVRSLGEAGWQGQVYSAHWEAGKLLSGPAASKLERLIRHAAIGRADLAVGAAAALEAVLDDWKESVRRARGVGRVMATRLLRDDLEGQADRIVLMGFSLGTRVIYEALHSAATRGETLADDVFLLGGAAPENLDWNSASTAVRGTLHNFLSKRDEVLRYLYRAAEWDSPIGLTSIHPTPPNVRNHDVSEWIEGHKVGRTYEEALRLILTRTGVTLGSGNGRTGGGASS